jgi:competence protein ComEA
MNATPQSRARRVLALIVPIVALVALVLIGRRATTAAPLSAPTVSGTPDAVVSEVPNEDGKPTEAALDAAAVEAAPGQAIQQLPDGGVVIDLNLASEDDLRKLPGVGPARAKRILELRARLGRFKSVDDLARIKGFGKATLKRLRPITRAGA